MTSSLDRTRPRVWIDTDVALGAARGDVDDGFALAALFGAARRGEIDLIGVSTVFGNTTAGESETCALDLAARAGVSVEIVRGGEKAGQASSAAERIAFLPERTELLCLGPLTNVATACHRDPGLPARVSLRAVGGNLSSRGFLPPIWPLEFNFFLDRQAARFVLSRAWRDLTIYPLDVVRRLRVGREQLSELARVSPLGKYIAVSSERWLSRSRWRYLARNFPLWDLPPALDVLDALGGTSRARTFTVGVRWLLATSQPMRCLTSFDPNIAWNRFLSLL